MRPSLLALAAFVAMEPITAATHRFVMHGLGMRLHRSHHRRRGGWEANDAFPVLFGALVCAGMWIGFHHPAWWELVPVGVGVTAYGVAYSLVHDLYTHRRWRPHRRASPRFRWAPLDHLAAAHALHHRFGGPPYGMLFPVVPAGLRGQGANGSRPAQVPELA